MMGHLWRKWRNGLPFETPLKRFKVHVRRRLNYHNTWFSANQGEHGRRDSDTANRDGVSDFVMRLNFDF